MSLPAAAAATAAAPAAALLYLMSAGVGTPGEAKPTAQQLLPIVDIKETPAAARAVSSCVKLMSHS
jgi:hypothetical protein